MKKTAKVVFELQRFVFWRYFNWDTVTVYFPESDASGPHVIGPAMAPLPRFPSNPTSPTFRRQEGRLSELFCVVLCNEAVQS